MNHPIHRRACAPRGRPLSDRARIAQSDDAMFVPTTSCSSGIEPHRMRYCGERLSGDGLSALVPGAGIEPAWPRGRRILRTTIAFATTRIQRASWSGLSLCRMPFGT